MTSNFQESRVWYYKYMPTTLAELCLTKTNRKMLEEFVKTKSVPHMILYGRAGIGKTTLYHVLKNELGATGELYNGSKDRSINVLRDEITEILSKVTFSDTYDKRICAIDEFENISKDFMLALKGTIDDCDSNATFMFMTNTLSNVIDPILDRCELISLVPNSESEKLELLREYIKRACTILKLENVEFDLKIVAEIAKRTYPGMRNFVKALQKGARKYGKISAEILSDESIFATDKIVELLKVDTEENWKSMMRIISNMQEPDAIYEEVELKILDMLQYDVVRRVIKITSNYSFQAGTTRNKSINAKAFLTEIMETCNGKWKKEI